MSEWLAARSFERAHEVIAAINTISMHAKLAGTQLLDPQRARDAQQARDTLAAFLQRLSTLVTVARKDPGIAGAGTDPRLGSLVRGFVAAQRAWPPSSPLYKKNVQELERLLVSTDPSERGELISCLRELRTLIEQNVHADVAGILGDI